MVDFMGMMKKAEELQQKMQAMQEEAGRAAVEGSSGGGLVTVTISGKGDMKAVKIDPSLFKEDSAEILEDLIVTAHNEAKSKADEMMARKMSEMTQGLPLPPGMKLPF
jgi:DNA-binding YbaB/EbfC family protein